MGTGEEKGEGKKGRGGEGERGRGRAGGEAGGGVWVMLHHVVIADNFMLYRSPHINLSL